MDILARLGGIMISHTVEYALRILSYLAQRPDEWASGQAIANETHVPMNYLLKILNRLKKNGLVESQKGWGGGFMLKSKKLRTPIFEVVELFDGKKEANGCLFGGGKCDDKYPCPLHGYWSLINDSYRNMVKDITFGNLAETKCKIKKAPK
jgi:Rrf2 family transcriptional regulator, iron-sulfur cluster assembly transcription factor